MTRRLLMTVAGAFGAFLACQAPSFIKQYQHQLGGAVAELSRSVRHFDRKASARGLSREAQLRRYARSSDFEARSDAPYWRETLSRYDALVRHKRALEQATPFNRIQVYLAGRDPETQQRTMAAFEPSLPATREAMIHGAVGFLLAYVLTGAALAILFPGRRRRRA